MDMTPPQAPPALIQGTEQQATDAFNRVVDLQAWLANEQADVPTLPEALGPGTLQPYLDSLDAWWSAPSGTVPRRAAFAARIARAAGDLALLAHEDNNLDDAALAVVHDLVSAHAGGLPTHITVRELTFGDTVYAGVILVQDARMADRTLAFSAATGWESFATLDDAHAEMEHRARRAMVSTRDLPGIARQHLQDVGTEAFVASRDMATAPFDTFVERSIGAQRDKLNQAWFEFTLARSGDDRTRALVDTAYDTLRLDHAFDVAGILAVRHAALMETFNEERLAGVPAQVASDWRAAEDAYRSALGAVADREDETGLSTPASLATHATSALKERLQGLGVSHDPSDILVRIDRGSDPAARLESLQALFKGPAPAHIRLVDLAYQNMSVFDPVQLSAQAGDGTVIAALDGATIRSLVRDLDLSTRYQAYVEATFRTGTEATMRRDHAATLQLAHMGLLAAEARLAYYLTDVPRSFRADHAERGFRWVKAALDAPVAANRARVEKHDVVVYQMTYLGTPLRDLLVFGVGNPASVPSIVLYTPDAPDGISFREFDDRAEAARQFFYHPAFREYLLDRLPSEYARVLPNGSAREFAGSRLANWVLGSSSASAYTRTEAPFEERRIEGDFLAASYDVDVELGKRNVRTLTRSAEQANWAWLVDWPRAVMSNTMVEDAIKGVVLAPARAAQAAWRFYDNVKAGDGAQAFVDFADFYNTSLSMAAPVYSFSTAPLARAIAGARFRAAGRLVETRPAVQPAVVFESRFAAKGVGKSGSPNSEGIHLIANKAYIEHRGQMYGVRYDIDHATWRLARPGASPASYGPAIKRTSPGSWIITGSVSAAVPGVARAHVPARIPICSTSTCTNSSWPSPMRSSAIWSAHRCVGS